MLESAAGPTASVHVNWVTPTKIRTLRVTGTRGVCFMDYILQSCELYGGNLTKRIEPAPVESLESIQEHYRTTDKVDVRCDEGGAARSSSSRNSPRYLRDGDAGELCLGERRARSGPRGRAGDAGSRSQDRLPEPGTGGKPRHERRRLALSLRPRISFGAGLSLVDRPAPKCGELLEHA